MSRMGHGNMRAALIYQHATSQRDREIADALQKRPQGCPRYLQARGDLPSITHLGPLRSLDQQVTSTEICTRGALGALDQERGTS